MKPLFFLIFFILLLSCGEAVTKKPEDLIPETTMEAILYDLAILNSAKGISNKRFQENGVLPEAYLYEKYNIDSVQFANSIMYYAAKTELYIAIQKNVEARLQAEKQQAEAAKKINDSLKNRKPLSRDSLLLQRKRDTTRLIKT